MVKKIDNKLLILYKYLQNNLFSRDEVSKVLGITTRQLSRLMKQWESDQLLTYRVGLGRGVLSEVTFNQDIEQMFISYHIQKINELSFEELENILQLPLYQSSKVLLHSIYHQRLIEDKEKNQSSQQECTFIDYIYRIPKVLNPLIHTDVSHEVLIFNLMDRLFDIDEEMNFSSSLVKHEEIIDNDLVLYLYHDVKFSNGKHLFASDVVECITVLMNHKSHREKYLVIESIETLGLFSLRIKYNCSLDYLKLILSSASASIYIHVNEKYFGTGVYKIYQTSNTYITLINRTDSHHPTPDISKVYLINNYNQYIASFRHEKTSNISKGSLIQTGFMCFNPKYTVLDREKRKTLAELINDYYNNQNSDEILASYSNQIFEDEIVIGIYDKNNLKLNKLIGLLTKVGFNVKYKLLAFEDLLDGTVNRLKCDLFFLGHTYLDTLFYYSLMDNTNLGMLYSDFIELTGFIDQIKSTSITEWYKQENHFKRFIESKYWIKPLILSMRNYVIPTYFKNVTLNNNGLIIYKNIINLNV
ncbi:SgrR family transcriptional regulator [Macrococcus sp. DPC7161]|uniref:SgrR family transcriptional regulator n=1 Tax=Macrococcus sp. DPC7161 TaxID=2507060 RepID=UPI00100ACEAD|nr:SgrR family transcriptional regulator [Macrococcus sp. DPC7161]RXK17176.1 hypothetical protein ER639_11845 [Macrococcus sp. DPC7161]